MLLCLPHGLHHPFALQAAAAGVQLSIGQSSRCIPAYQQTKMLLAQNAIGPLLNIIHQRTFWIDQVSTDWRRDQSACGGLYQCAFRLRDHLHAVLESLTDI